jgi:bacterioferritin-associated ferredoxin
VWPQLLTTIRVCIKVRGMGRERTAVYICLCNNVTDGAIRRAVARGVCSFEELVMETGVSACCGSCLSHARECFESARREQRPRSFAVPVFSCA